MSGLNLDAMFKPRSLALIGVSQDFSKLSGRPLRFLLNYGYKGDIHLVNPKRSEIAGLKCYPTIMDVPGEVDLAVIMLPARMVPRTLIECGEKGVQAVIVISAGFYEAGPEGEQLNDELAAAAKKFNIALCGPNCSGLINVRSKLTASFSVGIEKTLPKEGPIAFISQSGALASYVLGAAEEKNLGFCYWVSTGNETILNYADYLDYFLNNEDTRLILGYMEDVRNGEAFKKCAAKALELGKPLVLIKVGRTEAAARAGTLHTRSETGDDKVYEAVFDKYGVIRAENLEEILSLGMLGQCTRKIVGNRLNIFSVSGGLGVLMADTAARLGFELNMLTLDTVKKLKEILPPLAIVSNPIDTTADILFMPGCLKEAIRLILADPNVQNLVIFLGIQPWDDKETARDIAEAAKESSKFILVIKFPSPSQDYYDFMLDAGVPVLSEPVTALSSLAKLSKHLETRQKYIKSQEQTVNFAGCHTEKVEQLLRNIQNDDRTTSTDDEGKSILEIWGLSLDNLTSDKVAANKALELVMRFKKDVRFGPIVTLGLGLGFGEKAEELTIYPAPLNFADAVEFIEKFKKHPANQLFELMEDTDFNELAQIISQASLTFEEFKERIEEINFEQLWVLFAGGGVRVGTIPYLVVS